MVTIWNWLFNSRVAISTRIPNPSTKSFWFVLPSFSSDTMSVHSRLQTIVTNPSCQTTFAPPARTEFLKYKKKTCSKQDKTTSDLSVGWYSKDDMSKVLKWMRNLSFRHYTSEIETLSMHVSSCGWLFFMDTMFFLVASLPNTNYGGRSYLESGKRLLGQSSAVSKTRKIWSGKSRGNMFDNNDINSFSTPLVKQNNNSVTYESFRYFFWILSIRLVQTCGCNNILLMQLHTYCWE